MNGGALPNQILALPDSVPGANAIPPELTSSIANHPKPSKPGSTRKVVPGKSRERRHYAAAADLLETFCFS